MSQHSCCLSHDAIIFLTHLVIKIPSSRWHSRRASNVTCRPCRRRIISSDQRISVLRRGSWSRYTYVSRRAQLAWNQPSALGNCATCPAGLTDGERDGIVILGKRPVPLNRDTDRVFRETGHDRGQAQKWRYFIPSAGRRETNQFPVEKFRPVSRQRYRTSAILEAGGRCRATP